MMRKTDIIFAPMTTLDDFVDDPQAHEAGCFVDTPDGWGGSFKAPAAPVRFPGDAHRPRRPRAQARRAHPRGAGWRPATTQPQSTP